MTMVSQRYSANVMRVPTQPKTSFVSVLVCSFNGGTRIGDCLDSLNKQTYGRDNFEIIVVDDGSIDDTSTVARTLGAQVVRFEVNRGISAARNAGLAAARSEIVVYIDDDCVADVYWLKNLVESFQDETVIAAGGKILALSTGTIAQRYLQAIGYGNPSRISSISGGIVNRFLMYLKTMAFPTVLDHENVDVFTIYTANGAYRKDALLKIGGFDESLLASEDEDIIERLRTAKSGRILYVTNALVRHRHYEHLSKVIYQPYHRAKYTLRYYLKHGKVPPIFPMPLLYGLLIASLILLNYSFAWLSVGMLALPLLLYGWWLVRAVRERSFEYLLYPYIQLMVESAVIIGLLKGFRVWRT